MIARLWNHALRKVNLALAFMAIIAGCPNLEGQDKPADVPDAHPGIWRDIIGTR